MITLNVGGTQLCTMQSTLCRHPQSALAEWFEKPNSSAKNSNARRQTLSNFMHRQDDGSVFIDRDPDLFRQILEYLRTDDVCLPEHYADTKRLIHEAEFYGLDGLAQTLKKRQPTTEGAVHLPPIVQENGVTEVIAEGGHITIGYRGSFAFGRDGQADVKFRKVHRILVHGKAALCRSVFGDTLNESRDPDREGLERYTQRLYLKHQCLEKAFDALLSHGFKLVTAVSSGANGVCGHTLTSAAPAGSNPEVRGTADYEESRWARYTEFVFGRGPLTQEPAVITDV